VPAYVYGCLPDRMGALDERVPVEEFLNIVRVHTLSAYDYLEQS
jgi:succinyl-diaminopimelate desuccinylase